MPSSRRCAAVSRLTSCALASARPARPTSSSANLTSATRNCRPERPTPSPSEPSGPPPGASGMAIVQRRPDWSRNRRVLLVVDHGVAQVAGELGELGALAAQRAGRGRAREPLGGAAPHDPHRELLGVRPVDARREPARRAVRSDHVDPRGIRHPGHEHLDEPRQRLLHVGGAVGDPRRLAQQQQLAPLDLERVPRGVRRLALTRGEDGDRAARDHGDQRQQVVVAERARASRPGSASDRMVATTPTIATSRGRARGSRHREDREQVPGAAERALARGDVDDREHRLDDERADQPGEGAPRHRAKCKRGIRWMDAAPTR